MVKVVNGMIVDFGSDTNLVIPKEATSISRRCYETLRHHNHIESITVEEGNAVYFAENNCLLKPHTVLNIILGCKNSIIPDGTQYPDTVIGQFAFNGVEIENVVLPKNLMYIGTSAFADSNLENVYFHDKLWYISDMAFMSSNLKSVIIPKSVAVIGVGVFANCKKLESIKVDEDNNDYYAENNCLVEKYNKKLIACVPNIIIPRDVEKIEALTFYGMDENSIITMSEKVMQINKSELDLPICTEFPVTFKAPKGSYAIRFAKENGIKYIEI